MTIISIITILRIVICFQRRHESTVKRFGPSVGLCWGREKEQNPCVPHWIWRDHESTIVNTWRPNHNGPIGDCRKVVSQGTGCSKPAAHHCTWCGQAPNSCIVQSGPCAELSLSIPMSQAVHLPANNHNNDNNLNNSNNNKKNMTTFFKSEFIALKETRTEVSLTRRGVLDC